MGCGSSLALVPFRGALEMNTFRYFDRLRVVATCIPVRLAAVALALSPMPLFAGAWTFVHLPSGSGAFHSSEESLAVVGEFGERAAFCDESDAMFCFSSRRFEFAFPRAGLSSTSRWEHGGRVYCVHNSVKVPDDTQYIIYSRIAGGCGESTDYDAIAIVGAVSGLRLLRRRYSDGGVSTLYATQKFGFGSKSVTER